MALSNLSIKVTADIGGFTTGMESAAQAARDGMGSSSGSVNDFRMHLLRASDDLQQAARSMSSNMEAANDAIVSSSQRAADAVLGVSQSIDQVDTRSMHEKVAFAVGAGVGAGVAAGHTAIDTFIDYIKTRLIIAGLALVTSIAAGVFTTIYLISKAVGTIGAMMDGSFFKSENIDALIATNKELLDLQQNLRISSFEAGALNEAMKRLGVDKGDYKAVYEGVSKSIHENGEELDRLGVKTKDANGKFLESRQVIENAMTVLDTYTEGWDRNAAAAAIGIGSYDKITQVLKVTSAEVQTSKERLDDYQLGVTAGTQKMVADYEQAMRDFSRENDLAEQGFKRVYADAVMPLFTDMANLFKEGWPSIVQFTRFGVAAVVATFYTLEDGIYAVVRSVRGTLESLAAGLGGIGIAMSRIGGGDVKGAAMAMAEGWTDAKNRIKDAGADIVASVQKSDRAIALARATDGRDASIASAKLPPATGRAFVAKPKDEKAAANGPNDDPAKKLLQGQIAAQEAFIAAEKTQLATRESYLQYYYQLEYTNASDYYGTKNKLVQDALADQLAAYDKEAAAATIYLAQADTETKKQDARNILADIGKKRTAAEIESNKKLTDSVLEQARAYREFDLATTAVSRQYDLSNAQSRFQLDLLGKGTLEVAKLTEAKRIELALEQRLYDIRNKGLPEAEATRAATVALMQKNTALQLIEDSYNAQRTAVFGASEAMRKYAENTGNQAAQVEGAMTNAFAKAEDAFVSFVKTGKLDFRSLADSIITDLIRMQAKAMFSGKGSGGGGGIGDILSNILGSSGSGGSTFDPGNFISFDGGGSTGEGSRSGGLDGKGGFMALLHPQEHVTDLSKTSFSGGGGGGGAGPMTVNIVNQTTGRIDEVIQQGISPTQRDIIIREATQASIQAVAQGFGDPNHPVSKGFAGSYKAQRVRA